MSTISISLTSEPSVAVSGIVWRPWQVLKQAVKDLLVSLADFVNFLIRFVVYLPVLIVKIGFVFVILVLVWKIGKWVKGRIWPGRSL
jgi:hypothetical protein